jgi:hypothetical protein
MTGCGACPFGGEPLRQGTARWDILALALAKHPPPAELHTLRDAIGALPMVALIEAFGGTRIKVPAHQVGGSVLAGVVGLPGAKALSTMFGGEMVKVPLAKGWRIRLYRAEGLSYTRVARRLGVSESAVHKYLQLARMTALPAAAELDDDA